MLVDKKIVIENGFADREFLFGDALYNNIWYSLQIKKGSMFYNREFGSELHLLRSSQKMTSNTYELAKEYIKKALQWILDAGRLKSFESEVEQNSVVKSRLDITITALRSDNKQVTYNLWYNLV